MRFSVIIPTYNREHFCMRAVKSVLNQKNVVIECLVVDDCSTDSTISKLNEIKDSRLKILTTNMNSGGSSKPINIGIANAKYEYIAFLDSDDYWNDTRLYNISILPLNELNEYQIFYTSSIITIKNCLPRIVTASIKGDVSNLICSKNILGIASRVIVKKSLLQSIGGFDESRYMDNDWECWMRICQHSKIYSVLSPSVYYFQNPFSISSDVEKVISGRYKLLNEKFGEQYILKNDRQIKIQICNLLLTRGNNLAAREIIKNINNISLQTFFLFFITFINNWLLQNCFSILSYLIYVSKKIKAIFYNTI